jgi:glycosyltransferase involved in cell wall biosynthesis
LGALKETGNNFGICYEYEKDKKNHVKKFAKILNSAITEIENKKFNPKNQAKIIEKKYNWERFEKEWENFYELL